MTNNGNGETDFNDREHEKFSALSGKIAYILVGLGFLIFGILLFNAVNDVEAANKRQDKADAEIRKVAEVNRVLVKENRVLLERQKVFNDQSCRSDEREHKIQVKTLVNTYSFLIKYPNGELAQAVRPGLADTERRAGKDTAPKICDRPGLGLPEPDPCVPGRPKALGGDGKPVVGRPCKPVKPSI